MGFFWCANMGVENCIPLKEVNLGRFVQNSLHGKFRARSLRSPAVLAARERGDNAHDHDVRPLKRAMKQQGGGHDGGETTTCKSDFKAGNEDEDKENKEEEEKEEILQLGGETTTCKSDFKAGDEDEDKENKEEEEKEEILQLDPSLAEGARLELMKRCFKVFCWHPREYPDALKNITIENDEIHLFSEGECQFELVCNRRELVKDIFELELQELMGDSSKYFQFEVEHGGCYESQECFRLSFLPSVTTSGGGMDAPRGGCNIPWGCSFTPLKEMSTSEEAYARANFAAICKMFDFEPVGEPGWHLVTISGGG